MEESRPFGFDQLLAFIARGLIRIYQGLTFAMGRRCRFAPSCSAYAHETFVRYGFVKGLWRTTRRLLKCHPWHPGGWDPV